MADCASSLLLLTLDLIAVSILNSTRLLTLATLFQMVVAIYNQLANFVRKLVVEKRSDVLDREQS